MADSATTSNTWNSVAADCTGNKELIGTGFKIWDGLGQVGIDDPKAPGSTRLTVWAFVDDTGFSGQ